MMAWRLSRALVCALLWLAAIMSAMQASAAEDDWQTCVEGWADADFGIDACTSAINSGKYKDHDLAVLYVNRGIAYQDIGDLDRAIADLTEAIRLDPNHAAAYRNRGGAWYFKGDYDRAIADCTEAIRLDPANAQAYNIRSTAWRNKWDLERAIADYTEAIRREKKDPADLYYIRGITSVYAGSLPAAFADLNRAAELDPKNAWTALWLVIANNRSRRPNQLAQATAKLDMTKWPAPLVRLFLSQAAPQAVLEEAGDADAKRWQGRLCEADFYVGVTALMRAAKEEAENLFKLAVVNCPKRFTEWWTANAELRALGMRQ